MKIAIVTGASSGMGRETVIQLWEQFDGFDEIWAVARRRERLEELSDKVGVPLRILPLDLADRKGIGELGRLLEEKKPKVKFLVNAAGFGKIGQVSALKTVVTRLVLPYMAENSRIIQFASSASFLPQPGFSVYAATKAYVQSFSRALNRELKDRRIYVTAVCPGPVRTEFFDIAQSTGEIPLYKQLVMADPKKVTRQAIRDSIAGREVSVYGITMKAFRLLCKLVPHSLILDVMEKIEYRQMGDKWN